MHSMDAIEVIERPGGVRLSLSGDLDLASAPALAQEIDDQIRAGNHSVEIDFTDVGFIDSSGLAILVRAQRKLAAEGHALVLRALSPNLMRIFDVTGLVRHFRFSR